MTLYQHFGDTGGVAKVAINLEGRVRHQQVGYKPPSLQPLGPGVTMLNRLLIT